MSGRTSDAGTPVTGAYNSELFRRLAAVNLTLGRPVRHLGERPLGCCVDPPTLFMEHLPRRIGPIEPPRSIGRHTARDHAPGRGRDPSDGDDGGLHLIPRPRSWR